MSLSTNDNEQKVCSTTGTNRTTTTSISNIDRSKIAAQVGNIKNRRVCRCSTISFPLPTILEEGRESSRNHIACCTDLSSLQHGHRFTTDTAAAALQLKNDFDSSSYHKKACFDTVPKKPQRSSDTVVELLDSAIAIIARCDE